MTIFQNISNLRDVFYKEMSKVLVPEISVSESRAVCGIIESFLF